jgi:hypothetical protein
MAPLLPLQLMLLLPHLLRDLLLLAALYVVLCGVRQPPDGARLPEALRLQEICMPFSKRDRYVALAPGLPICCHVGKSRSAHVGGHSH